MAKKYFVVNKTGRDIEERKPGLGTFTIRKDEKLECPKEIAEAIVMDFVAQGLSVESTGTDDIKPKVEAPKPKPPIATEVKREKFFGGKR